MSEPYYSDESVTLHLGDCRDVLAAMKEASVDAVVTDPPYDLTSGKKGGSGEASLNVNHPGGRSRITTGGGFMGKEWDATGVAFDPATWRAVMRVLKPGGHLLAFGGTRTWHRMVCAIEDAGFEIRDPIADLTGIDGPGLLWVHGQGFPKSLDVSKAIDKRAEENIETRRRIASVAEVIRTYREAAGLTRQEVSERVMGTPTGACWNWEHQQLPSVEVWPLIKVALGIPSDYDGLIEGDRAQFIAAEREVIRRRTMTQGGGTALQLRMGERREAQADITAPATDDARRWEGWGTALKPAWEPICVARKPLAGTVAQNVVTYGTGALNIAGCLVEHASEADLAQSRSKNPGRTDLAESDVYGASRPQQSVNDDGRWPPNVVLGGTAADELDRQSGVTVSRIGKPRSSAKPGDGYGMTHTGSEYADSGGASRFFPVFKYEPKAPASERPKLPDGTAWPTVKPLDLMRWLVRLVTPPGGVVLDPFCGTATTAEACIVEGFSCITIDQDPVALQLAMERLRKPIQPVLFGEAS